MGFTGTPYRKTRSVFRVPRARNHIPNRPNTPHTRNGFTLHTTTGRSESVHGIVRPRRPRRTGGALCHGIAAHDLRWCNSSRRLSGQSSIFRWHRTGERSVRQEDSPFPQHDEQPAASSGGSWQRTPPHRT
uniref:Uncharacterized protein n=1 Tax=Anopheles minimus TaxID=112268 RepID=A0A182VV64_9DIPT